MVLELVMIEDGASFDKGRAAFVPFHRAKHTNLSLPYRELALPVGLVVAKDLRHVPPPKIALEREQRIRQMAIPDSDGRTYSLGEIKTFEPFSQVLEGETVHDEEVVSIQTVMEGSLSLSSSGILIAGGMDLYNLEDTGRRTIRQLQRTGQYEKLIKTINGWEKNHQVALPDAISGRGEKDMLVDWGGKRGGAATVDADDGEGNQPRELSIERKYQIQQLLPLFRRIAASWYDGELSQEPQAKQIADEINNAQIPDETATIAEIEAHLRSNALQLEKIYEEAEIILRRARKVPEPLNRTREDREAEKKENGVQKTDDVKESVRKLEEAATEIIQSNTLRASGVLYIHDPVKDEPSIEEAAKVRKILARPF